MDDMAMFIVGLLLVTVGAVIGWKMGVRVAHNTGATAGKMWLWSMIYVAEKFNVNKEDLVNEVMREFLSHLGVKNAPNKIFTTTEE